MEWHKKLTNESYRHTLTRMKFLTNIKYFLFIGFNWNWQIALYLLRDNIYGEKKYQINTIGYDKLTTLRKQNIDISHSTLYMPVSYKLLEELFDKISLTSYSHFIDIGCGKGRALCVAAKYGVKNITGIDFSKTLCLEAEKNISAIQPSFPNTIFIIENKNATEYIIPHDVDCIFLFNPFDEIIIKKVVENIQHSLEKRKRAITVIYVNPMHKELFTEIGFKQTYHIKKLHYLEAIVLEKSIDVFACL